MSTALKIKGGKKRGKVFCTRLRTLVGDADVLTPFLDWPFLFFLWHLLKMIKETGFV